MKAAIYTRLSEEDKDKILKSDDSNSIKNQKSMLLKYAMERGWEIYNIYSDDDYAGADRNRPAFKKLISDAGQHKFDIILCKSQSRFTREIELVEKYIHGLFPIWNIRFISIADNADTADVNNKKSRQINALVNEWYLEDMSANIKSVLNDKRKSGYHIGSFALYGYKKDPDKKGHLIVDSEAAQIVHKIFLLFSKGFGKTAIAKILNEQKIPNPTEYKRLNNINYKQPKSKNSTLWKYSSVSSILTNEIYIGNMVQGRYGSVSYKTKQNRPLPKDKWYVVKNTHEPIIDIELWNKVQALIKQKAKPFSDGSIGLFAKKAVCKGCGYIMRSTKSHGKYYLKCPTHYISKTSCAGSFISVNNLEQAVLNEFNKISAEFLNKEEIKKNIILKNDFYKEINELNQSINLYHKKIYNLTTAVQNLYLDKARGDISSNEFSLLLENFHNDKEKYEKIIEDLENEKSLISNFAKEFNIEEIIESYINLKALNREIIDQFIDYILIDKNTANVIPAEIHWSF